MTAILAGNRIREKREGKGYTQQHLADLAGCRRETIANLERGKYNPSLELCDRIALFLDCTIYDLFELMTSTTEREQRMQIKQETSENTLRNFSSLAAKFCD